jgi:hypothetical protein
MSNIEVETNKNIFLVYSLLRYLGHLTEKTQSPDYHYLCRKTVDHFAKFDLNIKLTIDDYIHHSKPVTYALTIEDAPSFKPKNISKQNEFIQYDVDKGSVAKDAMVQFYQDTDFEEYYQSILPRYSEEVEFLQQVVDRDDLNSHLNDIWTIDSLDNFEMVVIPMPLEGKRSGIGPSIENTAYQVVGPPFNIEIMHNLIHEASHPRAKKVIANHLNKIEESSYLFNRLKDNPKFPKSYTIWRTAFEEHLVRSVQIALVDSRYQIFPAEVILASEKNNKGMDYIYDFYDVIVENTKGKYDMGDIVLKILDVLKSKYD